MKILAIETSGKYGSAAVIDESAAVKTCISTGEMNHLKDIISISDEAMKAAGIKKNELTHIAASVGPGSFTGIRIGVTTARTLAQALDLPCIAVSSLEAMACRVQTLALQEGCSIVVSIINARRHQTYAAAWRIDETGNRLLLCESRQYMIEELLELLKSELTAEDERLYFTGDGIDAYSDIIAEALESADYSCADEEHRYQTAETVAIIAAEKLARGETLSYEALLPDYMRLSEAEQRLKEGTLSAKIKRQN